MQEDVVPVVLTEFDYLITKKKLEEDEDFKDFVNPVTKAEVSLPTPTHGCQTSRTHGCQDSRPTAHKWPLLVLHRQVAGIGDPNLRNLKKGEVIQLERRGFYICDRPYLSSDKPVNLFLIPDGKAKAMSTLSGALRHV
jgi:glutamyl-tRNA synthetase